MAKLREQRAGEAIEALHHPSVSDIDLVRGEAGDPERNFRDGYGLAHIEAKHPEILGHDLQQSIAGMEVTKRGPNRIQLEDPRHVAKVRLDWDGEAKQWLPTAFEKETPPSPGGSTGVPGTPVSGGPEAGGTPPPSGSANPIIEPKASRVQDNLQPPAANTAVVRARAELARLEAAKEASRTEAGPIEGTAWRGPSTP